jgi:hypothetical protein
MGIREFQPGYRDFLHKQRSPATGGGPSSVAGLTFVMFTAGPAPAGQPFAVRAPAGPGAAAGGFTEASAPPLLVHGTAPVFPSPFSHVTFDDPPPPVTQCRDLNVAADKPRAAAEKQGGSRAIAATSDRHGALLELHRIDEPSRFRAQLGAG